MGQTKAAILDRWNERALLADLQQELDRLEQKRSAALRQRDRVFAIVDNGDDTGYHFNVALKDLQRIEQRIEQVRAVFLQKKQQFESTR